MGWSTPPPDFTTRILKHERPVLAGLAALIVLSWYFLASGAGLGHAAGGGMDMPGMAPPPLTALILMWWLMMAAMMLPSATPAILLYGRVRSAHEKRPDVASTGVFLAGYLAVWFVFSVLAAIAQQRLTGPAMALESSLARASLLIAAGIYQLTPLKRACLSQCQSPAQFISRHWRPGTVGAFRLGVLHGAYCVGCCWLLMALLFVGGIMNFAWIAALTLLVLLEKLLPGGKWVARLSGIALIIWGLALALS
ncbi:MAG TPA: DUF2182 domain-containing protein [Sphingomicrobium sp.]